MWYGKLALALGVAVFAFKANVATAQDLMACGDRKEIITELKERYSEHPISIGLAKNGAVLELFVSQDHTFSLIMTQPTGVSCLIAGGDHWESLPKNLVGLNT